MTSLIYKCRNCAKETKQFVRIVTDNLPPNVHVLECSICSFTSIGLAVIESESV
jgi:hypothetical protein